MAERASWGRWALGAFGCLSLMAIGCCCGGALLTTMAPSLLFSSMTEAEPLPIVPAQADPVRADEVRARYCASLVAGEPATLTADELGLLLVSGASAGEVVARVDPTPTGVALRLSVPADSGYLNVTADGTFTMEHGWFTDLRVDRAVLSGWDLSDYVRGAQLAQQANSSLAREKGERPQVDAALGAFDRVWIADGALHFVAGSALVGQPELCALMVKPSER